MEWLAPWYSVSNDSSQVEGMERELRRELSVGHPLFDLPVRTLARRQDCDDALFALEDGSNRVAVVHLNRPSMTKVPVRSEKKRQRNRRMQCCGVK